MEINSLFFLTVVPAIILYGIAKSGLGGSMTLISGPLMTIVMPLNQALGIILPILIQIGNEGGVKNVIKKDFGIRKGVYTFGGMMTNKTLSKMFDLSYKDLDLITAAI